MAAIGHLQFCWWFWLDNGKEADARICSLLRLFPIDIAKLACFLSSDDAYSGEAHEVPNFEEHAGNHW